MGREEEGGGLFTASLSPSSPHSFVLSQMEVVSGQKGGRGGERRGGGRGKKILLWMGESTGNTHKGYLPSHCPLAGSHHDNQWLPYRSLDIPSGSRWSMTVSDPSMGCMGWIPSRLSISPSSTVRSEYLPFIIFNLINSHLWSAFEFSPINSNIVWIIWEWTSPILSSTEESDINLKNRTIVRV